MPRTVFSLSALVANAYTSPNHSLECNLMRPERDLDRVSAVAHKRKIIKKIITTTTTTTTTYFVIQERVDGFALMQEYYMGGIAESQVSRVVCIIV